MKISRAAALIPLACLMIGGCKFSNPLRHQAAKAPTGQVAATVNGEEITVRQLQAEMGGTNYPDAKTRKLAEQQALESIIGRKILADAALKQGIDKTPDFALQKQRTMELLLAQSLENKVVTSVPAPTHEEAERFILDNPDIFAQRKVFTLDQIVFPKPSDPAVIIALGPLKTLDQVKTLLEADHIQGRPQTGNLDAVGTDPRLVAALLKVGSNDLLMMPVGQNVVVNKVESIRVVPFSGDQAVQYATLFLRRQHAQEAVQRENARLFTDAKSHVAINKAYQPAKPAAAAHPAAAGSAATNSGPGADAAATGAAS